MRFAHSKMNIGVGDKTGFMEKMQKLERAALPRWII